MDDATAELVCPATSRDPSAAKASAPGWAPNRSAGVDFVHTVPASVPVATSRIETVSAPALAQTTCRPSGLTANAAAC